jgi:hypothetical protein
VAKRLEAVAGPSRQFEVPGCCDLEPPVEAFHVGGDRVVDKAGADFFRLDGVERECFPPRHVGRQL